MEDKRLDYLKNFVSQWSDKYIYQIFFHHKEGDVYFYSTEFSLPTSKAPIPGGIVKVMFSIKDDLRKEGEYEVEYVFENESLRHRPGSTLRTNMFEEWIDRILKDKMKNKSLLHLGTEFEYTRTVDEYGNILDPFVEHLDTTKDTDFSKYLANDESTDVESSGFSKQLKKSLISLFKKADKNKNGVLEYDEFSNVLLTLKYDLSMWDVKLLMSIIDTNNDGVIQYEEFLEIAIDAIMCFLMREKIRKGKKKRKDYVNAIAAKKIFWEEIEKANHTIQKKFKKMDVDESGKISVNTFLGLLKLSKITTAKENNILIHHYAQDGEYEYANFDENLYEIRFNFLKSELLDFHQSSLEQHIIQLLQGFDKKQSGYVTIPQIQEALLGSKICNLSPLQIYMLIGEVETDLSYRVNIIEFARAAKDAIMELYSIKSVEHKLRALAEGAVAESSADIFEYDKFKLFGTFKRYDTNKNGYLEIKEYKNCLKDCGIQLSEAEISALALAADTNHDNQIDYEEFMIHFISTIKMIKFQSLLKDAAKNVKKFVKQETKDQTVTEKVILEEIEKKVEEDNQQ